MNSLQASRTPEPCIFVIFGATGDLTARKLMPALYNLAREGLLPAHFACVGFARRDKDNEIFRKEMLEAVNQYSRVKPVDPTLWDSFSQHLFYHRSAFDKDEGYASLKTLLKDLDTRFGTQGNRLFYLSVPPSHILEIVPRLSQNELVYPSDHPKWSRVIVEKPFGNDFDSAVALQKELRQYLSEDQIYRIDHYLGKETVQNLLYFRFSNPIFEYLWNNHHIDHVQITVAEEIGIGTRGRLWEGSGMLRDIVQNHMMQLLSLLCMEAPVNLSAHAIHDEKVKVLEAIRPIEKDQAVRGQYGAGIVNGKDVDGYREEPDVNPQSQVETYAALELYIDSWRWAGVPFFLRAGKRLPKRATEIAIFFKKAPGNLLGEEVASNVLVIRIQPNEGISLKMNCKVPATNNLVPVKMDFKYGSYFGSTPPEAYERLICDCMAGDSTLFARDDEVLTSWKLLTPVLERWAQAKVDFPNYPSGTWGPAEGDALLESTGREWRLL